MVAFAILPFAVPAASTLVNDGPRVQQIDGTYPDQVKVLQSVDAATLAALQANPEDQAAQVAALAQLTGMPAAKVTKVVTLGSSYEAELQTAAAVDPDLLGVLATDPTNAEAGASGKTDRQCAEHPGRRGRRQALAAVPPAQMAFLQANGPAIQAAGARLQSVSQVPAADLAFLSQHADDVQRALADNPEQWQRWWWICLIGQLLFLPCVLLFDRALEPEEGARG